MFVANQLRKGPLGLSGRELALPIPCLMRVPFLFGLYYHKPPFIFAQVVASLSCGLTARILSREKFICCFTSLSLNPRSHIFTSSIRPDQYSFLPAPPASTMLPMQTGSPTTSIFPLTSFLSMPSPFRYSTISLPSYVPAIWVHFPISAIGPTRLSHAPILRENR